MMAWRAAATWRHREQWAQSVSVGLRSKNLYLNPPILQAIHEVVSFHKKDTHVLVETFESLGLKTYGGKNAPYVWVKFPGRSSWEVFSEILEKAHIVTTPAVVSGLVGKALLGLTLLVTGRLFRKASLVIQVRHTILQCSKSPWKW